MTGYFIRAVLSSPMALSGLSLPLRFCFGDMLEASASHAPKPKPPRYPSWRILADTFRFPHFSKRITDI